MIVVLVMKLILPMRMMIEIVIVIVMAMLIMTRVKMIIMILIIIIIITKTMMHPIRNVRFHVILRCYYMYSYVFRCSCCHDILLVFVCSELSFMGHCDHVN